MPIGFGWKRLGRAFDYRTQSNYFFDFDSSVGVTSSSGVVSSWVDRTGVYTATPGGVGATLVANAQNQFPALAGDGSTVWMKTGNINFASNIVTLYWVASFPSDTDGRVPFEHANNAQNASGVKGFTCIYNTAGPGFQLSTGTLGGTANIRGSSHIIGSEMSNVRVYSASFDVTRDWPITLGNAVAPSTELFFGSSRTGSAVKYAQSGAFTGNYDTAPLNLFARTTNGTTGTLFSKMQLLRLVAYNALQTYPVRRQVIQQLQSIYGC